MNFQTTFIVAVSGGIDSVVLLHMIMNHVTHNTLETTNEQIPRYIVAHYDHGMRADSQDDMMFVKKLAQKYKLVFESEAGSLGSNASEQTAREARYDFLRRTAQKYHAEKIITAHHQDDVLETIVLNILRGTGPRGLNPMQGQHDIVRPLLHKPKKDILKYAQMHNLKWREDSTNTDDSYQRNYVRLHIMPKLEKSRTELLRIQKSIEEIYHDIDLRLQPLLPTKNVLLRTDFVLLPWSVRRELVRAWLLRSGVKDVDRQLIERLAIACMTLPITKRVDINNSLWLVSEPKNVLLTSK